MRAFTCDKCGGTFAKGWSDEKALAEAAELWGDTSKIPMAVICDDCFNQLQERNAN